jgi:hypothetical protein
MKFLMVLAVCFILSNCGTTDNDNNNNGIENSFFAGALYDATSFGSTANLYKKEGE